MLFVRGDGVILVCRRTLRQRLACAERTAALIRCLRPREHSATTHPTPPEELHWLHKTVLPRLPIIFWPSSRPSPFLGHPAIERICCITVYSGNVLLIMRGMTVIGWMDGFQGVGESVVQPSKRTTLNEIHRADFASSVWWAV